MPSAPPTHYLLPLFPGFQLLDAAGPLDILNLLSLIHPPTGSLTLTLIASTLDPVPTKPIPPIDPITSTPKWTFPDFPTLEGKVNTTFSQSIVPNTTFESYLTALSNNTISDSDSSPNKPVDVLFIPGGIGTRINRTDPKLGDQSNVADLLDFIPKVAPHVRHSIVTVCTGSDVLGQTGLLNTRRATTNMTRFDEVAARSPQVKWQKARRWVRSLPDETAVEEGSPSFHGEIWSSAGISAGMDVTLAFVAEWYGGVEVARATAKNLEYEWREIPEGAVDPMYDPPWGEGGGQGVVVDQS